MSLDNIYFNKGTDHTCYWNLINHQNMDNIFNDLNLSKPVCYSLVTDEELLLINQQTLNHDYYTDIITLDYGDDPDFEYNEIYISVDRVNENANINRVSIKNELQRVFIHGLLHLSGVNDKSEMEQQKMTSLENHYLSLYCST